jgi:hypothetical protein
MRLLAAVAVHDAMRWLPGFVENVGPRVDGIVALDDASTDGSGEYLAEQPSVLEVVRHDEPHPDERDRFQILLDALAAHDPGWVIGLDADERLERDFRRKADRVARRARLRRHSAYAVRFRELWDDPGRYRVDGVWDRKWQALLWRYRSDHEMDPRPLHTHKAPMQGVRGSHFPPADLTIFHLGMLTPEDRAARRARFERLDPDRRWQPMGYEYLTDPTGIELADVPPELDYRLPPTGP